MIQDTFGDKVAKAVEEAVEKAEVIPVVHGDIIRCKLSMMKDSPIMVAVVEGTYKSFRGAVKVTLPNNNTSFIDPRCVICVLETR